MAITATRDFCFYNKHKHCSPWVGYLQVWDKLYSLILNVAWEHLRIYCLLAQLRVCDDVIFIMAQYYYWTELCCRIIHWIRGTYTLCKSILIHVVYVLHRTTVAVKYTNLVCFQAGWRLPDSKNLPLSPPVQCKRVQRNSQTNSWKCSSPQSVQWQCIYTRERH